MNRFVGCLVFLVVVVATSGAWGAERPNVVFFLADDLGYTDLGCYGSTFYETPRIDEFCKSGMKFTRAYTACPVCSPTRASILTGKSPARVGITDWIPGQASKGRLLETPEDLSDLPLEELTLAETLEKNGYHNFHAGKWHLGRKTSRPETQGFTEFFCPGESFDLKEKEKTNGDKSFKSPALADASIEFIYKQTSENPFFLYLCFYDPHTPIVEYEDTIEHFKEKAKTLPTNETETEPEHKGLNRTVQNNAGYASMVKAVDTAVGRVLDALKAKGLDTNTIVIFTSDNGGLSTLAKPGPTSNVPWRAGKGWLYEGGIRVPLIVRAPGVTKAGTVCNAPVVSTDYYPTLLELVGLGESPQQHVDGVSFASRLKGDETTDAKPDRDLFWHYPHYHGSTWTPGASVISGRYKLIAFYEPDAEAMKMFENRPRIGVGNSLPHDNYYVAYEVYDLENDPYERHPLNDDKLTEELSEKLIRWQNQVGAKLPTIRPVSKP